MTLQPFTKEQLNYFKFAFVVLNEFPKALRQAFKNKWDNIFGHLPGFQPWDDSVAVRNMFLAKESGSTKVPTHLSYDAWDCTALFQATIFSKSFSMPDGGGHHRTLSYLFVRPHRLPTGGFHASVISPTGNDAESFALAIDQLRLLRNAFCHSPSSEIPKATFDMYMQLTKDAFQALSVSSSSVNAIGNLTETDFPIEKVRKLEDGIRKELQAERTFLKEEVKDELTSMRSDIAEANQERRDEAEQTVTEIKEEIRQLKHQLQEQNKERKKETSDHEETIRSDIEQANQVREKEATLAAQERKEVIQEIRDLKKQLELAKSTVARKETIQKLAELNRKLEDITIKTTKQDSNPILPKSNLPSMVPNFTGREKECNDVIAHATNEATRLVSIWGSPGFGKTSTAIAVGHRLQAQGLPIYFLSLRGMRLKSDLTSKFLGLFTQTVPASQRLTADDELCWIFAQIPDRCIFILDNADDLFESDLPNVKEDVVTLIGEFLNRSDKVKFLLTTRESCEFLNLRFKGHHAVRIRELDEQSSSDLAQELLPEASKSDRLKVAKKCGSVPLAMKLLCFLISEDGTETSSESINMFLNTSDNVLEMLDNPDYPSNTRLKCLFDASFQKLSAEDKEALVSLSILPEHFDLEAASAVLGMKTFYAVHVLKRLQRKSLIDSSSKAEKYSIHKLILSFVQEKGESEMKETVPNSKVRYFELYISLFERLTEEFLTGRSMSAYLEFFQNEASFIQSLIDGCQEERTVGKVCNALIKAEMFVCFLYLEDKAMFGIIYESAIEATTNHDRFNSLHKQLLLCKAYGDLVMGSTGETETLLSEAKQTRLSDIVRDPELEGKLLSYNGLYKLSKEKTEGGVKLLEEALSSMETIQGHRILKLIIFQVLSFYRSKSNPLQSLEFYKRAVDECNKVGDIGLLVIPKINESTKDEGRIHLNATRLTHNQPLQTEVIILVSQAVKKMSSNETTEFFCALLQQILTESGSTIPTGASGRFNYQYSGVKFLKKLKEGKDSLPYMDEIMNFDSKGIQTQSQNGKKGKDNNVEAVESAKRALHIRLKVLGEEHSQTAHGYYLLGLTQHSLGDFVSALESMKRALDIRLKALGEDHSQTADSYDSLGVTQHSLGDFVSALESKKRALAIRLKALGKDHSQTADSYHSVGVTQRLLGDLVSALQSAKRALDIRIKVLGEEHSKTADSRFMVKDIEKSLSRNS